MAEKASFMTEREDAGRKVMMDSAEILWATDEVLLATSRNGMVQAFDADSGKERWKVKFEGGIVAMACDGKDLYVALTEARMSRDAKVIRRMEVATGKETTPEGMPLPFLPMAMEWCGGSLCVVANDEVWVYAGDLMSVTKKMPYAARLPKVSSDGKLVLLAEHGGRCSVIDPKAGKITPVMGTWREEGDEIVIDAPFLSNAFHESGGAFIRIIDNSWATGRIYFHATPASEPKEVDSGNGHAVAAVHWPTKQLAVSGTGENLLIFTTAGETKMAAKGAVTSRTWSMAFSPSGKKLATLGEDGTVKVFAER